VSGGDKMRCQVCKKEYGDNHKHITINTEPMIFGTDLNGYCVECFEQKFDIPTKNMKFHNQSGGVSLPPYTFCTNCKRFINMGNLTHAFDNPKHNILYISTYIIKR